MDEERYLILKMLEEGKVTAEEAAALLEALEEQRETPSGEEVQRGHRSHSGRHCRSPHAWAWDSEGFNEGMEEMRRHLEKIRLGAIGIGDEVSRRFQEAFDANRGEWRRGGPRPFRHFIRNLGDVFSVPFGREMHEEKFEREIEAPSDCRVDIRDLSGDVKIEAWDREAVKVLATKRTWAATHEEARKRAGDYEIVVERNGSEVWIGAKLTEGAPGWLPARSTIDYEVWVPATATLEVGVTNGKVTASGVRGGVDLRSTNGDVKLRAVAGRVLVHSVNGDIYLRDVDAGELTLRNVNGDVDLDLASLGPREHSVRATRGDVRVALPATMKLDLLASTMHGNLDFGLPGAVISRSPTRIEARLGGAEGGEAAGAGEGVRSEGTRSLVVRTLFGDITLRDREGGGGR